MAYDGDGCGAMKESFAKCDTNRLIFDWSDFVSLLSVDGVAAFASELGWSYWGNLQSVQALARACGEVEMFGEMATEGEIAPERVAVRAAWRDYRQTNALLTDDELRELTGMGSDYRLPMVTLFERLAPRWLTAETTAAIVQWFIEFSPETPDRVGDWWHLVRRQMRTATQPVFFKGQADTVTRIEHSLARVRQMLEVTLPLRFEALAQDLAGPSMTAWNRLLSIFPADTPADDVNAGFWLGKVEKHLARRFLLQEWRELAAALDDKQLRKLIQATQLWVAQTASGPLAPP